MRSQGDRRPGCPSEQIEISRGTVPPWPVQAAKSNGAFKTKPSLWGETLSRIQESLNHIQRLRNRTGSPPGAGGERSNRRARDEAAIFTTFLFFTLRTPGRAGMMFATRQIFAKPKMSSTEIRFRYARPQGLDGTSDADLPPVLEAIGDPSWAMP